MKIIKEREDVDVNSTEKLKQTISDKNVLEAEEHKYWIARMAKQSAIDLLTTGRIQSGNLDSMLMMSPEDRAAVADLALTYSTAMNRSIGGIKEAAEQRVDRMLDGKPPQMFDTAGVLTDYATNNITDRLIQSADKPKTDVDFVEETFIPFLLRHNNLIYDLYFTSRMPPFEQDAMGDVFVSTQSAQDAVANALYILEKTMIPLSATFNNIWVRPDQKNLDTFIKNFKFLYDNGVRCATIPHTSWVSTGQIQREYPELKIKNTILREVVKPNEIVSLASAGFHYINLDRDIMRDQNAFEMILKAKEYCANKGNPIELSLLANEHCWGGCPIMPEHYQYNSTRKDTEQNTLTVRSVVFHVHDGMHMMLQVNSRVPIYRPGGRIGSGS